MMGRGPTRRARTPPRGGRGDDRRYPRDRRRQRSPSPPFDRYRRSPPPFKRFRGDEEPPHREDERFMREPDGHFDRRGPPPFRERGYPEDNFRGRDPYMRGGPPSPPRKREPMSYKEFVFRELGDDVTPEQSQQAYQSYLADFWGSQIRAEFESHRNAEWMRKKYDPREFQRALEQRNEAAKTAAKDFADDLASNRLDPKSPVFNQGQSVEEDAPKGEEEGKEVVENGAKDSEGRKALPPPPRSAGQPKIAPEVCWNPERVAADLALSKQLMEKLDPEKGIENNPLLAPPAEGQAKAEDADKEEGENKEDNYDEMLSKLDTQLVYLWRVHALDYYGGVEIYVPSEYEARGTIRRTLRGPRPEEGEKQSDAEEKKGLALAEKKIDSVWKKRLTKGDPFEARLEKERVSKFIDDFVESQITQLDDNKWGSKLSQKLFVGKEYVVKHIRLKHTHVVDAERDKVYEELYWENFKRDKEEEEQKRKAAELAEQQKWAAAGPWGGQAVAFPPGPMHHGFSDQGPHGEWGEEGYEEYEGPMGGHGGRGFGGPGGFGGLMGHMGGPPLGRIGSGGPLLEHPIVGGPLAGPAPGMMLVPAPGAGPLGPFIQVPMGGDGGPGPMGPPMMRGPRGPPRGGRMGPMGGRGPPPGRMGMPPVAFGRPMRGGPGGMGRHNYYDLDAPENQRSVLDYGDL